MENDTHHKKKQRYTGCTSKKGNVKKQPAEATTSLSTKAVGHCFFQSVADDDLDHALLGQRSQDLQVRPLESAGRDAVPVSLIAHGSTFFISDRTVQGTHFVPRAAGEEFFVPLLFLCTLWRLSSNLSVPLLSIELGAVLWLGWIGRTKAVQFSFLVVFYMLIVA